MFSICVALGAGDRDVITAGCDVAFPFFVERYAKSYTTEEEARVARTNFCKNLADLAALLPRCSSCGMNENMDRDMHKLVQRPVKVSQKLGTRDGLKRLTLNYTNVT